MKNAANAFVLRGAREYHVLNTSNTEPFKLTPDCIFSYKFEIDGKIIEYTDHDADISYDKYENEWVIVLDDLPFMLDNKTVTLKDIWFDENMIEKAEHFKFHIHSFSCTNDKTTTIVALDADHSDMIDDSKEDDDRIVIKFTVSRKEIRAAIAQTLKQD